MSTADDPEPTTDRWRRVEALYHEMLARPASERGAALAAACDRDVALAAEVQALLDQPESAAGFLAKPALEIAARHVSPTGSSFIGQRIGVFEVQGLLGVGGMGEVYRALDTRLQRTVAIKILPRLFTSDPDRLVRFEREARVLASLNHPNIGALYGIEEADGQRALVLEFVDGQTLGERIGDSGLPLPEGLAIARQIAEALDAAHEKGIVHRDLKPANVMLTPSGAVKVLDFGLAKVGGNHVAETDLSKSPTATRGGTREGAILGTAAYMSPEQARGLPVDKRTDIWAFGCVLYEMLTGRAPFARKTASDAIAAIIEREPDWALLPRATPPVVARLLRRCLEKDPRRRLRDIADACAELEDPMRDQDSSDRTTFGAPSPKPRPLTGGWALSVGLALAGLVGFGIWIRRSPEPAGEVTNQGAVHFTVPLPEGAALANTYPSVSISRDGRVLALVARRGAETSLFARGLDELNWRPLAGTEGAIGPFFSPDREWLAFFTPRRLLRVSLAGGAPQVVCDLPGLAGYGSPTGDWGLDGRIVFSYWPVPGFYAVPAAGGVPEIVKGIGSSAGPAAHYRKPHLLPGDQGLLFGTITGGRARIEILEREPLGLRTLVEGGSDPFLTRTGHLIYGWNNQLLALPMDPRELTDRGVTTPVAEDVRMLMGPPFGTDYGLSDNGTLVYTRAAKAVKRLVWADRVGRITPLPLPPRHFRFPSLSPNRDRVAVMVNDGPAADIWVGDLGRGSLSRLTMDGVAYFSLWSPDGAEVVFSSARFGTYNLFRKRVDTTGDAERLTNSQGPQRATGFSADGRQLLFNEQNESGTRIWVLPMGDRRPSLVVGSSAIQRSATFSPDGRWVAYDSNESGRYEVYVQAYPGPGEKRLVSTDGGGNPKWNSNGREIFYTSGDRLMSATFAARGPIEIGTPRLLFRAAMVVGEGPGRPEYDVTGDGERFLFVEDVTPESAPPQLRVVVNWFEELKRRVPVGRQPQP